MCASTPRRVPERRKSPTKLYVRDTDAVRSLVEFGFNHRATVADHCLMRFREVATDGERLSLAVECFACMIANVEDIEKAYFALRQKAAGANRSFFELYTNTAVREPDPKLKIAASEQSARAIRRQLGGMGLEKFRATLGLPTVEEWKVLGRAPANLTAREIRRRYYAELRGLKKRLGQAVANRAMKRLMNTYNKSKHGFVVLHEITPPSVFLIERAYGSRRVACWVQCMPFRPTEQSVAQLVENTRSIAHTMKVLLTLYGRVQMVPPNA
jgi:hypothetical protein